ncbi:hypothetical protein AUTU_04090 [Aureibacter tunicatorum]|nr:hypothetical protein AUTU_04090 [Aureibacter tunicatorum]
MIYFIWLFVNLCTLDSVKNVYTIEKIKSKKSFNIIYASNNDNIYKIIVKKNKKYKGDIRIKVGRSYKLDIKTQRESAEEKVSSPDQVKLLPPINYLDLSPCREYEGGSEICIEPDKGIYTLYLTDDIIGLYYVPK